MEAQKYLEPKFSISTNKLLEHYGIEINILVCINVVYST